MTDNFKNIFKTLLLLFVIGQLASCNFQKSDQTVISGKKYSIYAMMKDGKEYLAGVDSLRGGILNPEKSGVKVVPDHLFYELMANNDHYYRIDHKTHRFIKYHIKNDAFTEESALKLPGFSGIENYTWLGSDTLMIISYDEKTQKIRYAKIQIKEMKATQGVMEIPGPSGAFNWVSVGFSKFVNDKILVGYTYHDYSNQNGYTTSDTVYVEVLSYPDMKSVARLKDTRSAYPGGANTRQSYFFTDEKGDFYFVACPGIAAGNNPDKPTGIYRIRASQETLDPDYFFNISGSPIQNHGYGFWYIGNGKAILRTERKGLFTGMQDHWKVPHFDFYVLDLAAKSTTRLDLPLDKGTSRQCVLTENGLVYITVNSDSDGSYVWIYDPKTGKLEKGLKFTDDVDYILRLERFN